MPIAFRTPARAQRGLTLIELVIAIAIAAVLFGAVVTGVGAITGARAKESAGQLAGTIRAVYDEAALSGRTCRIVFELPPDDDKDASVKYATQCASGAVATLDDRDQEIRQANEQRGEREEGRSRRSRDLRRDDGPSLDDVLSSERGRVEQAAKFSGFEPLEVGRDEIPSSVRMSVWVRGQREPVKNGIAYLYFHPQGYADRAMVFVRQGDNAWTIRVSPLTGKAQVIPGVEEVPD